jgi:hypothetical protein
MAGSGRYQPGMNNSVVALAPNDLPRVYDIEFLLNPSLWFTQGVYGFLQREMGLVFISLLLFVTAAFLFFILTLNLLERSFYRGLYPVPQLSNLRRPRIQKNKTATQQQPVFSFSIASVLVRQNILLFIRDSRHFLQLILFCSMLIVITIVNFQESKMSLVPWDFASPFALMMYFLAFLTSMNTARAIPMERYAYGYIRIAPLPIHHFLMAKIGTSFVFSFLAITLSIGIFYIRYSIPASLLVSLLKMSFIVILGATGIGIFTGAFFAKFDWEHPKQMLKAGGAFTLAILCFLYWFITYSFLTFWEHKNLNIGFFIIYLISLGLIIMGTALAKNKLEMKDWQY